MLCVFSKTQWRVCALLKQSWFWASTCLGVVGGKLLRMVRERDRLRGKWVEGVEKLGVSWHTCSSVLLTMTGVRACMKVSHHDSGRYELYATKGMSMSNFHISWKYAASCAAATPECVNGHSMTQHFLKMASSHLPRLVWIPPGSHNVSSYHWPLHTSVPHFQQ